MSEMKPTPGPLVPQDREKITSIPLKAIDCERLGMAVCFVNGHREAEAKANSILIAEAFKAFHTTGMTPMQLVERVKEFEHALKGCAAVCAGETMSAKHTPGPWWITDSGVRDRGGYICHTNPAQRYPGQEARFARETAERAANKALIAAAPDLLNAAQAAWNCIAELAPTQARVEVAQLLQAAIEKAIGEQP